MESKDSEIEHEVPSQFYAVIDKHGAKYSSYKDIVNEDGNLKFPFFLDVYQTAMKWSDAGFKSKKQEYIKERRAIFGQQDPEGKEKYLKKCMLIKVEEEDYFYLYLNEILTRLGIDEGDFKVQMQMY